jgi:RNA 3'-terminal phosphate cyclase (ATP)
MIVIDGSYGEGGGQVVRTSLALSAISGRAVRIKNIRAGRRKPGLMPQQLTGVRAAARVCDAQVEGARLNAQEIVFVPRSAPRAGKYTFDVAQVAKGGSAGSVSLVFQTVLLPLALAEGTSQLTLRGGTHVAWSPAYDYLKRVYLPTLARMGVQAKVNIRQWGWYPIGGGEVEATIHGRGGAALDPVDLRQRGDLLRVRGLSASSNLPKHIRVRQEQAALHALRSNGVNARVDVVDAPSKGKGTAVFLWADFENSRAGFTSLGELGKPAEQVAQEAAQDLLGFLQVSAALERHLADQVVLPMALASGRSSFAAEAVTQHLLTNAWVVNQFFPDKVRLEGQADQEGSCWIDGAP